MHNCMSVILVPGSTSLTDAFSIGTGRRLTSRRAVLMGSPNLDGLKFYYSLKFDPNKNPSQGKFPLVKLSILERGGKIRNFSA
jgi:hypothetical protein